MRKLKKLIESTANEVAAPAYQKLLSAYQRSRQLVELGKAKRKEKRRAFEAASAEKGANGSSDFSLFIEFEKARLEQKIRRADLRLAQFQLKNWFREQSKMAKEKEKAAEKTAKKAVEKTAKKATAKPAEKAAKKATAEKAKPKAAPKKSAKAETSPAPARPKKSPRASAKSTETA